MCRNSWLKLRARIRWEERVGKFREWARFLRQRRWNRIRMAGSRMHGRAIPHAWCVFLLCVVQCRRAHRYRSFQLGGLEPNGTANLLRHRCRQSLSSLAAALRGENEGCLMADAPD